MLYPQKILIVEDVGLIALDIKTMLFSIGFSDIKIAYNGEEAIKLSELFLPDLILMDIMLGNGIDGIQSAREIQKYHSSPLIYITGSSDAETQKEVQETFPFTILIKPVHFHELEASVKSALQLNFNPHLGLSGV